MKYCDGCRTSWWPGTLFPVGDKYSEFAVQACDECKELNPSMSHDDFYHWLVLGLSLHGYMAQRVLPVADCYGCRILQADGSSMTWEAFKTLEESAAAFYKKTQSPDYAPPRQDNEFVPEAIIGPDERVYALVGGMLVWWDSDLPPPRTYHRMAIRYPGPDGLWVAEHTVRVKECNQAKLFSQLGGIHADAPPILGKDPPCEKIPTATKEAWAKQLHEVESRPGWIKRLCIETEAKPSKEQFVRDALKSMPEELYRKPFETMLLWLIETGREALLPDITEAIRQYEKGRRR